MTEKHGARPREFRMRRNTTEAKEKHQQNLYLDKKSDQISSIVLTYMKTTSSSQQRYPRTACSFHHSKWNQHIVDLNQSIRTDCSCKRQPLCEIQLETKTTDETSDIVDDGTPVHHGNEQQPSPTPYDQPEVISDESEQSSTFLKRKKIMRRSYSNRSF